MAGSVELSPTGVPRSSKRPLPPDAAAQPEDVLATRAGWPGETRMLEFVLGGFLVLSAGLGGFSVGFPLRYIAMALLIFVAIQRRPQWSLRPLNPYVWLMVFLIGWFAVVSATGMQTAGASDWVRRLTRIALLLWFVAVAASGRIHLPSIIKGYALALVVNAVAFHLNFAPRPYGDYLTGYVGDKNAAALQYVAGGLLLLTVLPKKWQRVLAFLVFAVLVFQTGSRTTMAGMAAAMVWYFLLSQRHVLIRLAGGAGLVWVLQYAEENLARIGIFADREGTDWFREQIADAVQRKLAVTPPQGLGLGEAYVAIPQGNFYFHNSYDTLIVEGGLVALTVVLAVTVFVGMRPSRTARVAPRERMIEASVLAVLVCAWQLGEVFLTPGWALTLAVAGQLMLVRRNAEEPSLGSVGWPEPIAEELT